jgi:hypothetical protein
LEFGFPQNRAVEDRNEKSSTTAGAVMFLRILMTIQDSKVCIRVTCDTRIITGGHDKTIFHGSLEITANADESQFMMASGTEGIPSILMHSKCNIRPHMSAEVEQHSNNSGIVESAGCRSPRGILGKRRGFSQSADGSGKQEKQAQSLNNMLFRSA